MVESDFNLSIKEEETGENLSSRMAWSTKQVLRLPGLHKETLSGEKQKKKKNRSLLLFQCYTWLSVDILPVMIFINSNLQKL